MAEWCVDTLTLATQNPQATFINTQKYVGRRRLLLLLIAQGMFELLRRPWRR
jgi:hypothetical protein